MGRGNFSEKISFLLHSLSKKFPSFSISKMNDLLSGSFATSRDGSSRNRDIEMGTTRPMSSGELGLDSFFNKVQEIEKQYEKLNKLLKKLQDAHEESKAVTKAAAMKAIKQRM